MNQATSSDDELSQLRRVAAGDRKAFEALYHLYYRRLFAYLWKITRRGEIVEEVLNDVMLAIWTGAARFDGRSRPSTWIFGIAYHKALKALARLQPVAAWPEPETREEPEPVDADEPESLMNRRELKTTLGKALGALSPEQRAVVELTYYYELPYGEIAEIVGCPVNTVKTRMFHARKRLKQLLPRFGIGATG
ncbi:MAG TPA: sigma-70 family RNA polymerase sigma factor [Thermoanaerobaculia bacterium]|nr:sigma-70 family RNA polymerase sigma factor [Thermoanaerobaculia bacterium]